MTYTEAANNALNHTLIRSLNTTLVAILPVAAILFIGTTLLGAGTLKDLSLALFVGMLVGTYSSLCVATPLLVTLKEREPNYQAIARRLASPRRAGPRPTAKTAVRQPVARRSSRAPPAHRPAGPQRRVRRGKSARRSSREDRASAPSRGRRHSIGERP